MAVWSIVKFSELGDDLRIDAEFYHPEFINMRTKLKEKSIPIRNIAQIIYGTTPSGAKFYDYGIPFIRSHDFKNGFVRNTFVYCSKEHNKNNKKSQAKPNDVLIAAVGATIGEVAKIPFWIKETQINQNVALLKIKDNNIVSGAFLASFLMSRFGNFQLGCLTTGNAQQYLNSFQIGRINVYIPTKKQNILISKLWEKAEYLYNYSLSLLSTAESLLLSELGLDKLELPKTKWNIRNYSETEEVERMDGEYFLPKYYALLEKIKNSKFGFAPLLSKVKHKSKMMKPREDKEYEYIELADVDQSIGTITEASKIIGAELPSRARMPLEARNVILSSVEGSIDKVAIIPEELNNAIGSTGFFVFEEKEYTSELLLVLLRLDILKEQFVREARGTILTAINQNSLSNIIVPEVPEPLMKEISDKVREAHSARKEAKKLLEEAKHKVEEMILKE
ncbi:MAG: hypothetical protein J7K95_03600 [Thermoplasmata archaeon]|nr:hypothetical protein [Thermoplasmata archaeon]